MSLLIRRIVVAALYGLSVFCAKTATAADYDGVVTVYFRGEAAPNNIGGPRNGTITFSVWEGQISSNPAVAVRHQSTTATGWPYVVTPWRDLRMEVGRTYTLTTDDTPGSGENHMDPASMHPNFIAPPGYYIDTFGKLFNHWSTGSYPFRVMPISPDAEGTSLRAGAPESFTNGRLRWGVSLGKDYYGAFAGSIRLIDIGLTSDWSSAATRAGLKVAASASVSASNVYFDGSGLRQVRAPETFVDIVTISSTEYEIRFYDAATATLSGSAFPYSVSSGTPFVVYDVQQASGGTTPLKITSKTYGSSDYPSSPARTAEASISRTGTWPAYSWTVNDWTTNPNTAQLVQNAETWSQVNYTNATAYSYSRDSVIKNAASSEVAAHSAITMETQPWGEAPTSIQSGDSSLGLNSTYTYYSTGSDLASFSRIKSITASSGAWEAYEYTHDSDGNLSGMIIHRPYLNSPSSVPTTLAGDTSGVVTTYVYASRQLGEDFRLASVEEKINGVTTKKTEFNHTGILSNGIIRTARYDWVENNSSTRLLTISRYYSAPFRQPFSTERPDHTKDVFVYQIGTWNGSAFSLDNSANLATAGATRTCVLHGTNDSGMPGASSQTVYQDSPLVTTDDSGYADVFYLVANRSTMEATIRNRGRVVRTESFVWDGSNWQLISAETFSYDTSGFVSGRSRTDGSVTTTLYTATYTGELKTSETDETGITINYATSDYDAAGRLTKATRAGSGGSPELIPAVSTSYVYDAANHVKSVTVASAEGTEQSVTSQSFDSAGRVTSHSVTGPSPGVPITTNIAYDAANRTTTVTMPTGKTRIETHNLDGSLAKIEGTGVVPRYYTYDRGSSDGRRHVVERIATDTDSRLSEAWADWAGRTVQTSRPGFAPTSQSAFVEQSFFDNAGNLVRTSRTGFADTRYEYDSMGQLARTGLDVDASSSLTLNSMDRITDTSLTISQLSSVDPTNSSAAWWVTATTTGYLTDNDPTPTTLAVTKTRLSGFTSGQVSVTTTTDFEGNVSFTRVSVDPSTKTVTTTSTRAGVSNTATTTAINGYVTSSTGFDGLTFGTSYDGLLRPSATSDLRTGSSTVTYKTGTSLIDQVVDAANNTTTFGYDNYGRTISVTRPDSSIARMDYDDLGRVFHEWGSASYPVQHEYNAYGQQNKLTTWKGTDAVSNTASWVAPSSDTELTQWTYDGPSGLMHKKTAANNSVTEYRYNEGGQIAYRSWSRRRDNSGLPGSDDESAVITRYVYDGATGELTNINYNDHPAGHVAAYPTTDVVFTYRRTGAVKTVTDDTGTRTFTYDNSKPWRLDREELPSFFGSRWLSSLYEASGVVGRANGFQLGSSSVRDDDTKQEWYFDAATGRVQGVKSSKSGQNPRTFTYGYETNSDLLKTLSILEPDGVTVSPFSVTRAYEAHRDLITSIQSNWSSVGTVAQFDYGYTALGQRDWEKRSGTAYLVDGKKVSIDYQYNDRGELTKALTFSGDTFADNGYPLPNLQHEYAYDNIGNRTSANQAGDGTASSNADMATFDSVNQMTTRGNKTVIASGTVASGTTVAVGVNGGAPVAAERQGSYWSKALAPANSSGPDSADFSIYAAHSGAVGKDTRTAFVGQQTQSYTYDADGNLTGDGVWTYDWDAENRLVHAATTSAARSAGFDPIRVEYRYDYMGRRVQKRVFNESTNTEVSCRRYIYSGWNLIAEYDAPGGGGISGSIKKAYTWGLDARGGGSSTGALLQEVDYAGTTATYLAAYDGNGNVAALYEATGNGTAAAIYEYSPYGEILRAEGTYAKTNPFRHSTQFTDDETGLVYYGHRYYSPRMGRFINRDPIEEAGGLNLYGFVRNDPINDFDLLGFGDDDDPPPPSSPPPARIWWFEGSGISEKEVIRALEELHRREVIDAERNARLNQTIQANQTSDKQKEDIQKNQIQTPKDVKQAAASPTGTTSAANSEDPWWKRAGRTVADAAAEAREIDEDIRFLIREAAQDALEVAGGIVIGVAESVTPADIPETGSDAAEFGRMLGRSGVQAVAVVETAHGLIEITVGGGEAAIALATVPIDGPVGAAAAIPGATVAVVGAVRTAVAVTIIVHVQNLNATKPIQNHHFLTNKHKGWSPRFRRIADKYGLSLDGAWNKEFLPHLGRHTERYHRWVDQQLTRAAREAGSNKQKFLDLVEKYIKQPVRQNPGIMYE